MQTPPVSRVPGLRPGTLKGPVPPFCVSRDKKIPEQDKGAILDAVTNAGIEIYPDSVRACEDRRDFFDRTYDGLVREKEYRNNQQGQFLFSDCLGGWVVGIFLATPLPLRTKEN